MSDTPKTPSSLDGIKRFAKAIRRNEGLTHGAALHQAAKLAGYNNYTEARKALEPKSGSPGASGKPRPDRHADKPPRMAEFIRRNLAQWEEAVDEVDPDGAPSLSWTSPDAIAAALAPFLGPNLDHAMLPTGGGNDIERVAISHEPGCLDLYLSSRHAYRVRPKRLTLERLEGEPGESFLLLELDELSPSGVYDDEDDEDTRERQRRYGYEEVLELAPGEQVSRSVWDEGHLGYDVEGMEIPLPRSATLLSRWFAGKFLFVAKGSLWNGESATYDGRHNRMQASQIREVIEASLAPA